MKELETSELESKDFSETVRNFTNDIKRNLRDIADSIIDNENIGENEACNKCIDETIKDNEKNEQDGKVENSLSPEEEHLRELLEKAEEATNPSIYDTYEVYTPSMDNNIEVFAARKRGKGHVKSNKPCQDFCQIDELDNCIILTDADGVSKCERSDVGSKIACEVVKETVKVANKSSKTENEFIDKLLSIQFRKKLVNKWLKEIMEHSQKTAMKGSNQFKEVEKYGSTLMFAIITANWYVVGNIGDGQVLVFNDEDAVKLRIHPPKESSKVRALTGAKCYLEDFQVGKYSRKHFNGLLLSSDGMYDVLNDGRVFHNYALQIKRRFIKYKEPLQPFCYEDNCEENQNILKDLSYFRTSDDCSIVLAIDQKPVEVEYKNIKNILLNSNEDVLLKRNIGSFDIYSTKNKDDYYNVVISPRENRYFCDTLCSAEFIEPDYIEEYESKRISVYKDIEENSIEYLYCNGKLREQYEVTVNASEFIGNIYLKLKEIEQELNEKGYKLNEAAHMLIFFDEERNKIYLAREAISFREEMCDVSNKNITIWSYFKEILGFLYTGDNYRPIFETGFLALGKKMFRLDCSENKEMCRVEKVDDNFYLRNISDRTWNINNTKICTNEKVPLLAGLSFNFETEKKDIYVCYHYISKE